MRELATLILLALGASGALAFYRARRRPRGIRASLSRACEALGLAWTGIGAEGRFDGRDVALVLVPSVGGSSPAVMLEMAADLRYGRRGALLPSTLAPPPGTSRRLEAGDGRVVLVTEGPRVESITSRRLAADLGALAAVARWLEHGGRAPDGPRRDAA